jgi:DNA-binding CsgD family transcriptional regulator
MTVQQPQVSTSGQPGLPHQVQTEPLSFREKEVAFLVSYALTDREIAATLFITVDTVKTHVKNICAKVHLKNRTDICRWVLVKQFEERITLLGNVF